MDAGDLLGAKFLSPSDFGGSEADSVELGAGLVAADLSLGEGSARWLRERFELSEVIGEGAMGVVLRARDRSTDRLVALKLLKPRGDSALDRFLREGELLARLTHPGIVRIHSSAQRREFAYTICELVEDARPLDEAWEGRALAGRLQWIVDAAEAVGHAHAHGIVHRDLKPANVLIDGEDRLRIIDFGVAHHAEADRLTKSGTLVGTPTHVAPEQALGQRDAVGPATDVWALGVCLYQALTGELPFTADDLPSLVGRVVGSDPTPPRELASEVPRAVERVCLRALSKRPEQRFRDGADLAQALRRAAAGRPWVQTPAPLLGVVVVLLGALALSDSREPRPEPQPPPASPAHRAAPAPSAEPDAAPPPEQPSDPTLGAQLRDEARALRDEGAPLERQLQAWSAAIAADPAFANAYTERGLIRAKQGDLTGAIEDYDAGYERYDPRDLARRFNRSWRNDAAERLAAEQGPR